MSVAAWVDGQPVGADEVAARLATLRARDRAGALPAEGTREARQLRRWLTQVLVVERLCVAELKARRVPWADGAVAGGGLGGLSADGGMPSRADTVALGSIVAAAWAAHPAVRRAVLALTEDVRLDRDVLARAATVGADDTGLPVWSADELLLSARLDAFSRWLAGAVHARVVLSPGYEHPGDSSQPDNLHRH